VWLANCYLPIIPYDSPPCYHSLVGHLVVLFIHFIATLARLLGPGGVRSLVAESLLLKHQLLIVDRSRQRTANLRSPDLSMANSYLASHAFAGTRPSPNGHPCNMLQGRPRMSLILKAL